MPKLVALNPSLSEKKEKKKKRLAKLPKNPTYERKLDGAYERKLDGSWHISIKLPYLVN